MVTQFDLGRLEAYPTRLSAPSCSTGQVRREGSLRAESLPASFLLFLFLAATAAASGIACLTLTRRSEHPGLGGLEIVVLVAVIAALVPMVRFWFAGGFVALALIFGMH